MNLLVALVLGAAALGTLFLTRGYLNTWRMWNIPVAWPPFMDVRVITAGAEAHRRGLDPMVANPTDSSQRPLNYPRIWQGLYALGYGPADTVFTGVALMLLFGVGLGVFVPRIDTSGVALILAALFSPAVLLGLERGNTDLLMFFLLAVAIAAARRGPILAMCLVLLAFVLKLFPLFGAAVILGQPRRTALRWLAVAAVIAALYVGLTFGDLEKISAATPRDTWLSYGFNVLWMKVAAGNAMLGSWTRGLTFGMLLGLAFAAGAWWHGGRAGEAKDGPHANAFRVGAACYVGTFLAGNNFVYRLVFLIFAIPQLWDWARGAPGARTWSARLGLAGMYVAMWSMVTDRLLQRWTWGPWTSFLVSSVAEWTVLATLVYLFLSSAPGWFRRRRADLLGPPAPLGAVPRGDA